MDGNKEKLLIAIAQTALNCVTMLRESYVRLLAERDELKQSCIGLHQALERAARDNLTLKKQRESLCSVLSKTLNEARSHGCIRHSTALVIELAIQDSLKRG